MICACALTVPHVAHDAATVVFMSVRRVMADLKVIFSLEGASDQLRVAAALKRLIGD